jgi:hypothetical protein
MTSRVSPWTPPAACVTSEAGGDMAIDVVLDSEPTADVIIPITSSDISPRARSA